MKKGFMSWFLTIDQWTAYGGPFYVPPWETMLLYFFIGMIVMVICWTIHARFFFVPIEENEESVAGTAGRSRLIRKSLRLFLVAFLGLVSVIMAPWEELIFRGLVLWLSKNGNYGLAILSAAMTSVIFGLLHKTNPWHVPWLKIFQYTIFGFVYALACIITLSLWPAIFAHVGRNVSVAYFIFNKKHWFRLARKLQR